MLNELTYSQEVYRKFIHISSSIFPLLIILYGKDIILPWIIIIAIIFTSFDYVRRHIKIINKCYKLLFKIFTRPIENKRLTGASWVIIGVLLTTILFEEKAAIIGLLVLSISDSLAAIIGLKFGKTKILNKSLEGSFVFFLSTIIILIILSPLNLILNIIISLLVTFVELFSNYKINDNLSIPLITALLFTLGKIL